MNTDKLMELVEKVRDAELFEDGVRADLFIAGVHTIAAAYMRGRQDSCDELAAALRAEQAVGDEQRARELLASEYDKAGNWRSAVYLSRGISPGKHADIAIRAIRRALGTARQPEGVVLRDSVLSSARFRAACYALVGIIEGAEGAGRRWAADGERLKDTREWVAFYNIVARMRNGLAAAPGGEGEGKS